MKYFKKIVGERLYLSPMNALDTETYVKWLSDRKVTDNLGMTSSIVNLVGEKEYIFIRFIGASGGWRTSNGDINFEIGRIRC